MINIWQLLFTLAAAIALANGQWLKKQLLPVIAGMKSDLNLIRQAPMSAYGYFLSLDVSNQVLIPPFKFTELNKLRLPMIDYRACLTLNLNIAIDRKADDGDYVDGFLPNGSHKVAQHQLLLGSDCNLMKGQGHYLQQFKTGLKCTPKCYRKFK